MMANRMVQILKNMKMLIKRSETAHGGNPWVPLEMKGVTSLRHPSAEVIAERLVRMESGRCFPEVRKIIQSRQFLKHLKRGLKFRGPKSI